MNVSEDPNHPPPLAGLEPGMVSGDPVAAASPGVGGGGAGGRVAGVAVAGGDLSQEWVQLPVAEVLVGERQRVVDEQHVRLLADSFRSLGVQIQPIVVDEWLVVVDGAHRLAAAKQAGWSSVGAMVVHGATELDRSRLELEANRLRKQLPPARVWELWKTFGEPVITGQAKQKQVQAGIDSLAKRGGSSDLESGGQDPLMRFPHKRESGGNAGQVPLMRFPHKRESGVVSVREAAKTLTGLSLDTLQKIGEIHDLAGDPGVPEPLQEAAGQALARLEQPKAKVEPVYQGLQKLAAALLADGDPVSAGQAAARQLLDEVLVLVGRVEERFTVAGSSQVVSAGGQVPDGVDRVQVMVNGLVQALARLSVVRAWGEQAPNEGVVDVGARVLAGRLAQCCGQEAGLVVREVAGEQVGVQS